MSRVTCQMLLRLMVALFILVIARPLNAIALSPQIVSLSELPVQCGFGVTSSMFVNYKSHLQLQLRVSETVSPGVFGFVGANFCGVSGMALNSVQLHIDGPRDSENGPFVALTYQPPNSNASIFTSIPISELKILQGRSSGPASVLLLPKQFGIPKHSTLQFLSVSLGARVVRTDYIDAVLINERPVKKLMVSGSCTQCN